jgi:hypothetical protein
MKLHVEMTVAYLLAAEVYEVATVTGATRGETPNENPAPRRRTGGVPGLPGRGGLSLSRAWGPSRQSAGRSGRSWPRKKSPARAGRRLPEGRGKPCKAPHVPQSQLRDLFPAPAALPPAWRGYSVDHAAALDLHSPHILPASHLRRRVTSAPFMASAAALSSLLRAHRRAGSECSLAK